MTIKPFISKIIKWIARQELADLENKRHAAVCAELNALNQLRIARASLKEKESTLERLSALLGTLKDELIYLNFVNAALTGDSNYSNVAILYSQAKERIIN